MISDFPEFDEQYNKVLLPDNPDQFDFLAAKANFNIYHSDIWRGTAQRFAQSIVEECAKIIESQDVDPAFKNRMSWALKTRFGIQNENT
jgi:hypothetical protein